MASDNLVEHFVTLFDNAFLPLGLALHESLTTHANPFHLWIVCIDEVVEEHLGRLSLPYVSLISLREIETAELLAVKPGRSRAEYCWTLTPFVFQAVFERDATVQRVTYLDADLFFFASPQILLAELDQSGKQVLITEHTYAPEHSKLQVLCGRFCVQFLTVNNSAEAAKVIHWWQEKCLEWCFARFEDGKFGDQKYLECWPELFSNEVHVVRQVEKTLAPWNVHYFEDKSNGTLSPVFYHFHDLRIRTENLIRLYCGYKVGKQGLSFYESYLRSLQEIFRILTKSGIAIPTIKNNLSFVDKFYHIVTRANRYKRLVCSGEK